MKRSGMLLAIVVLLASFGVGCGQSEALVPAPVIVDGNSRLLGAAYVVGQQGWEVDLTALAEGLGGHARPLDKEQTLILVTVHDKAIVVGQLPSSAKADASIDTLIAWQHDKPFCTGVVADKLVRMIYSNGRAYRKDATVYVQTQ